MPLTQTQINAAIVQLLDGHDTLQLIRDGVANGEIIVQAGGTGLHLRAAPRDSPIARALMELYVQAGRPKKASIAEGVGVSEATIYRLLDGSRVGTWPTVRLVIEYLGGNPADYRRLWQESKRRRGAAP